MRYKIFVILMLIESVFCISANSQHISCDYSMQNDKNLQNNDNNEACTYNKMFSYSNTDTLAKQIIYKILRLIYIPPNFSIKPCDGINTCRAYVHDDGIRYIFYDRNFINKIVESNNNQWGLIAILAHELGHHLCGSPLISSCNDECHRNSEIDADRFAGSILSKMNASESEAIESLILVKHPACQEEIYSPYPCFEKRKAAVLAGFKAVATEDRKVGFQINKDFDNDDFNLDKIALTIEERERNKTISYNVKSLLYKIEFNSTFSDVVHFEFGSNINSFPYEKLPDATECTNQNIKYYWRYLKESNMKNEIYSFLKAIGLQDKVSDGTYIVYMFKDNKLVRVTLRMYANTDAINFRKVFLEALGQNTAFYPNKFQISYDNYHYVSGGSFADDQNLTEIAMCNELGYNMCIHDWWHK